MSFSHIVNYCLKPIGVRVARIKQDKPTLFAGNKYELESDILDNFDRETRKILNLLDYTKESGSSYNAELYENGYHTIQLNNFSTSGQRKPAERLADIPFDFTNTTVLDIGCNQGGMLFEIADQIKMGIGLDYDYRMVNVANRIKMYKNLSNVAFFIFDLEKENLDLIDNLTPNHQIDIIFLLSVCMWIKNWRDVIAKASRISNNLLFESNGTEQEQDEQENVLKLYYKEVTLLRDSSPDDPKQTKRKLFFCKV